jgi:hypothetical protein
MSSQLKPHDFFDQRCQIGSGDDLSGSAGVAITVNSAKQLTGTTVSAASVTTDAPPVGPKFPRDNIAPTRRVAVLRRLPKWRLRRCGYRCGFCV